MGLVGMGRDKLICKSLIGVDCTLWGKLDFVGSKLDVT